MKVIPFSLSRHVFDISYLLCARDMGAELGSDIPEFGLIAFEGEKPVAAGFIRQIEGNYAMLDSFISNPDIEYAIRDRALDLITRKLIEVAKRNNVRKLFAFSEHTGIIDRAIRNGFIPGWNSLLVHPLAK